MYTQRSLPPIFDVIIELRPGKRDEWVVIPNVADAVDKILAGKPFRREIRRRYESGELTVQEDWQG